MLKMLAKIVLLIVLLGVVSFSAAAPLKEEKGSEATDLVKSESDQDKSSESEPKSLTTAPPKEDEKDDLNKEVTNYQTIEVDGNSKVEEETPAVSVEEQNDLTEEEAQELLLELSNPVEMAQYIVASDDARGFLEALRLLTDQEYISVKVAYYLRDRVMEELRRMLMIQEMELSRTLLNNYQPIDFTQDQLPQEEPPAPYYDFNPFPQDEPEYPLTAPYDVYEETLRQENSRALAEIAEAVAEKISSGELTPENGVKIMNTVAGLLPDSYWEQALQLFADQDTAYSLDYDGLGSDYTSESLGSDVIQVVDDDDDVDEVEDGDLEAPSSAEELENELTGKNLRLENALEKQLAEKAHIKGIQTDAGDKTDQDTSDEDELAEEDYQAFLDWLEKEMGRVEQTDDVETLVDDQERSEEDGESKEINNS